MANKYQNSSQNKATKNLNQTYRSAGQASSQISNLESNQTSSQNTRQASGLQRSISRLARRIKKAKPKLVLSLAFVVALPLIALGVFFGTGLNQEFGASADYELNFQVRSDNFHTIDDEGVTQLDPVKHTTSGWDTIESSCHGLEKRKISDYYEQVEGTWKYKQDVVATSNASSITGCDIYNLTGGKGNSRDYHVNKIGNSSNVQLIVRQEGVEDKVGNCGFYNGYLSSKNRIACLDTDTDEPVTQIANDPDKIDLKDFNDGPAEILLRLPSATGSTTDINEFVEIRLIKFMVETTQVKADNFHTIDDEGVTQLDPVKHTTSGWNTIESSCQGLKNTKISDYYEQVEGTWKYKQDVAATLNTGSITGCKIYNLTGHGSILDYDVNKIGNSSNVQLIVRQEGVEDEVGNCGYYINWSNSHIRCLNTGTDEPVTQIANDPDKIDLKDFNDGPAEILLRLPSATGSTTDINEFVEIRLIKFMVETTQVKADNFHTIDDNGIKQIDFTKHSSVYCNGLNAKNASDYFDIVDGKLRYKDNTPATPNTKSITECNIEGLKGHYNGYSVNTTSDNNTLNVQLVVRQEGVEDEAGNCGIYSSSTLACMVGYTNPGPIKEIVNDPDKLDLKPFKDGPAEILLRLPNENNNGFEELRIMKFEIYIEPVPGCRSPFASNYNGNAIPPKEGEDDVTCEIPIGLNHIKLHPT